MKIAIVTLYDTEGNYGNRLQNYAVVQVIKKMYPGAKISTIYVEPPFPKKDQIKYWIYHLSGYRITRNQKYWALSYPRKLIFDRFGERYLYPKHISSIADLSKAYDIFVLGSDQVWNPNWYDKKPIKKDLYLLSFAKPSQMICFSPSFGISALPKHWEPWFQKQLQRFYAISVRESTGQDIIKELTGKTATLLVDPTMMLSSLEWEKIANSPKRVDTSQPYILTCFLGGTSEKAKMDLQSISKQYNLIIYNLLDEKQKELYITGPSEFLYLIQHATLVATDSFHTCVFSFLFEKPFLVYSRQGKETNMMSRIDTLLNKFHLENRMADRTIPMDLFACDYTKGKQILEQEQKKVMDFLQDSFAHCAGLSK